MPSRPKESLAAAAAYGHMKAVKRLLAKGANPMADNSWALRTAARYGQLEIVQLLLPVSAPKANGSQALQMAAKHGYINVVRLLLPLSDPKADGSMPLVLAAKKGHLEIVRLLLPVSDIDSRAISYAIQYGHLEIVKLLLPLYATQAEKSWPLLRLAIERGFTEVVNLLLPLGSVDVALENHKLFHPEAFDLFLTCLPQECSSEFTAANPDLHLPRTRAMLAAASLRQRSTQANSSPTRRRA